MGRYHARAGTLEWYSVDFWETELELDIMRLKEEVAHLIAIHPSVVDFLGAIRAAGKRVLLVTNAHHRSVTLKMARTGLRPHFDAIVTSHELGVAKEDTGFWHRLQQQDGIGPDRAETHRRPRGGPQRPAGGTRFSPASPQVRHPPRQPRRRRA